jgi:hypothetical protein
MLKSAIRANAIVKHISFNKDVISDALLAVTLIVRFSLRGISAPA